MNTVAKSTPEVIASKRSERSNLRPKPEIATAAFGSLAMTVICFFFFLAAPCQAIAASPWASNPTYVSKTGGKFLFGLKHSLFSWMIPWTESTNPRYQKSWEGFMAGTGKIFTSTFAGLVQLVTFPIPVDFPDIGKGLHIPDQGCVKVPYAS